MLTPTQVCGIGDTGHNTPWTALTFTTQGDNSVLVTENDAANPLYTASYKTSPVV